MVSCLFYSLFPPNSTKYVTMAVLAWLKRQYGGICLVWISGRFFFSSCGHVGFVLFVHSGQWFQEFNRLLLYLFPTHFHLANQYTINAFRRWTKRGTLKLNLSVLNRHLWQMTQAIEPTNLKQASFVKLIKKNPLCLNVDSQIFWSCQKCLHMWNYSNCVFNFFFFFVCWLIEHFIGMFIIIPFIITRTITATSFFILLMISAKLRCVDGLEWPRTHSKSCAEYCKTRRFLW